MNIQLFAAHIDTAIDRALKHDSYIDAEILGLRGFSTGIQRRIVSNITHLPKPDPVYLEVGLWAGASVCAAANNNPELTIYAVENFAQDFGCQTVKAELMENLRKYSPQAKEFTFIDADCFTMDKAIISKPVDVFYFDGEHSEESQRKAVSHFVDQMADLFVLMVDDYDWASVSRGTTLGFLDVAARVQIERRWILSDGVNEGERFHNGIAIFLCSKLP